MTTQNYFQNAFWCRSRDLQTEYTLFRLDFESVHSAEMDFSISADCRYNLYLDGKFLGRGPRRSDLEHYFYETYKARTEAGKHVLAVEVLDWKDRMNLPWSEIHFSGAFLASGTCGDIDLSTPGKWRCFADHSRRNLTWLEAQKPDIVYPAPPMEKWEAAPALNGWKETAFDDSAWETAEVVAGPAVIGTFTDPLSRWKLIRDDLPQMTADPIRNISVFYSDIETRVEKDSFSAEIPAGKHTVIIDLGSYYTYLPVLRGCGGKGSCRIAYGEALFNSNGEREYRGPVEGGRIGRNGYGDQLVFSDCEFCFQPFWFRSGRFIELEFDLSSSLKIDSFTFAFVHFPFVRKKDFHSPDDPVLEKIFEVGWHTALCCAHEHYEDCPYWEQLQYAGDTRIQALISYEAAGDGRLGRQAIRSFDWSRSTSGLTVSRYPSNFRQVIPEFSLFWILMISDYVDYFGDDGIISEHWSGIQNVLDYFERKCEDSGLIGDVGEWNFSDWVNGWKNGCSNRDLKKPETLFNLIYAETCRTVAKLAKMTGRSAAEYESRRKRVLQAVNKNCRTAEGLYQDVPGQNWFSQHTNTWAILSGAVPENEQAELTEKIISDKRLSQCTLYFQFYILEMLRRQKRWTAFRAVLKNWEAILEQGFTTFPECPSLTTRSDCHAWSAGPTYHLLKWNQKNS